MGDMLAEESWREGKEDGNEQDAFDAYIVFIWEGQYSERNMTNWGMGL